MKKYILTILTVCTLIVPVAGSVFAAAPPPPDAVPVPKNIQFPGVVEMVFVR